MIINFISGGITVTIWQAIILGIVQGLTEFLPVSSSGHLVLMQDILGISTDITTNLLFDTLLHLGTLFAVCFMFHGVLSDLFKAFIRTLYQLMNKKFDFKKADEHQKMLFMLIIATIPLFLIIPFKSYIENMYSSVLVVGIALIITSFFLFMSDMIPSGSKKAEEMKIRDAIFVGVVQAIAVIPGISRSGSTISGGIFCKLDRAYAAKFSFVMSIPAILGSLILQIADIFQEGVDVSLFPAFFAGAVVSGLVGLLAIRLLQYLLKNKKFYFFAIYCFIIGVFSIIWSIIN